MEAKYISLKANRNIFLIFFSLANYLNNYIKSLRKKCASSPKIWLLKTSFRYIDFFPTWSSVEHNKYNTTYVHAIEPIWKMINYSNKPFCLACTRKTYTTWKFLPYWNIRLGSTIRKFQTIIFSILVKNLSRTWKWMRRRSEPNNDATNHTERNTITLWIDFYYFNWENESDIFQ